MKGAYPAPYNTGSKILEHRVNQDQTGLSDPSRANVYTLAYTAGDLCIVPPHLGSVQELKS